MKLEKLSLAITRTPKDCMFNYSLTNPHSYRGSYDKIAFVVVKKPATRQELLKVLASVFNTVFTGHKGGEYVYDMESCVRFVTQIHSEVEVVDFVEDFRYY